VEEQLTLKCRAHTGDQTEDQVELVELMELVELVAQLNTLTTTSAIASPTIAKAEGGTLRDTKTAREKVLTTSTSEKSSLSQARTNAHRDPTHPKSIFL